MEVSLVLSLTAVVALAAVISAGNTGMILAPSIMGSRVFAVFSSMLLLLLLVQNWLAWLLQRLQTPENHSQQLSNRYFGGYACSILYPSPWLGSWFHTLIRSSCLEALMLMQRHPPL